MTDEEQVKKLAAKDWQLLPGEQEALHRFIEVYRVCRLERDRALAALQQISERDNVRNDDGVPPVPVALRLWDECVQIAKAALRETEGP